MTVQQSATFEQRLAVGREQSFVGRGAELRTFESMLADDSTRLWFIAGPGGIGKTTLLQALCARARARQTPFVFLDARNVRPNPPAARHALEQAAGDQPLAAFCARHAVPVLLIDTFEMWRDLEWWMRERLLPEMPTSLRVIVAGRHVPQDWIADPGWRDLVRVTTLTDLNASEAGEYLTLRGVDGESRQSLLDFSAGRPLLLALGADMAAQGQTLRGWDDAGPVVAHMVEHLVERFTRDADCPAQREALDAAAIVREINESLLARMLDVDDASELFQWLSQLSFMAAVPGGIAPHDQVRETLMHDMTKRFPGRYETCVQRAFDWIVSQIEAADDMSWTEAARLASDGIYTLRELDVTQHLLYSKGARSLYIEPATVDDWPVLADMVAFHEGAESRHWFDFWCRRQPQAVFVVRDPFGNARGMFMRLDMETLADDDREADPLTARLWRHVTEDIRPVDNAHVPFIRFWMAAEHGHSQSPAKSIILMAINSYNLTAPNIRLTAQSYHNSPEWKLQSRALGISLLADSDTVIGDVTWRIYLNDWQRESPAEYYRRFAGRCVGFEAAMAGASISANAPDTELLGEAAFRAAVGEVLKAYHTRGALACNPLLGSALVLSQTDRGADEDSRIRVLREQVAEAVNALSQGLEPGPRHARILRRTYIKAANNQKLVADALGLGYSTYRRRLAEARQALASALWCAETARR